MVSETEQVVGSIPGSVGYISNVHRAYDNLGPFGGSLGTYGLTQKLCFKKLLCLRKINRLACSPVQCFVTKCHCSLRLFTIPHNVYLLTAPFGRLRHACLLIITQYHSPIHATFPAHRTSINPRYPFHPTCSSTCPSKHPPKHPIHPPIQGKM